MPPLAAKPPGATERGPSRSPEPESADSPERETLYKLRKDPNLSATIAHLNSSGGLKALFDRFPSASGRREFCQLLGARIDAGASAVVEPYVAGLGLEWELQFNLGRLALTSAAPPFEPLRFAHLIGRNPSAAFTGSGATGINERTLSIPLLDKVLLALRHKPTRAWYSNPISSSPAYGSMLAYLATLTREERVQQGRLLLRRPITSVAQESYAGCVPSRAQVVRSAANAHDLQPHLVAAFLLAEQRDQSMNEDAAEYLAATSVLRADTSIGLGQVRVLTVGMHDLFADLLFAATRRNLGHKEIATLLVSEEFNIFAVARYVRKTADAGSGISKWSLPNTLAIFPDLEMAAYAGNSSVWPEDNIRALASKYTSTPWNDVPIKGWGDFVVEAYRDVRMSGCFETLK
jgi:hypothetical protein